MTDRKPDRFVQAVWLTWFLAAAVATGMIAAWFGWGPIVPW